MNKVKNTWKCEKCNTRYKGLNSLKIQKPKICTECNGKEFS